MSNAYCAAGLLCPHTSCSGNELVSEHVGFHVSVSVDPDVKVPFAVGGYLAQNNLAVIGQSDLLYRTKAGGRAVLRRQVECDKNFP